MYPPSPRHYNFEGWGDDMHTINAPTERPKTTDPRWMLVARMVVDHVEEVHEQEVGHKVFGRTPGYDTAADNIVRVHASMLRKRLELYFASEGRDEPLILEIPKGNYAPIFHPRGETPPASPERRSRACVSRAWKKPKPTSTAGKRIGPTRASTAPPSGKSQPCLPRRKRRYCPCRLSPSAITSTASAPCI